MIINFILDLKNIFLNPFLIGRQIKKMSPIFYFIFSILTLIIINCITSLIIKHFSLEIPKIQINELNFIRIVIVFPIIEEFVFRAILKYSLTNLYFFFIGIMGFILDHIKIYPIVIFLVILLLIFLVQKSKKNRPLLSLYDNKNYNIIMVYTSSLSFGIAHVLNFKYSDIFSMFIIIYVSSKIIGGFLFSMLRIKYGILYSIIFHIFNNLVFYLLLNSKNT